MGPTGPSALPFQPDEQHPWPVRHQREPIRWLERNGWSSLTLLEQEAMFRCLEHVGGRMPIRNVLTTLQELMAWNQRFKVEAFLVAPSNWQVAVATTAMLLNDWSPVLQPALAGGLRGLLDPAVTESLGMPSAPS